ncbi:hypothetical protein [Armatimonas rosea]|uniref:Uncharacterized protein n=1 Tax=Armatimonas rosea TaxID=685828 RepID=A0A7W9SWJ9_ARMRO|nr:hypothetical protein [Armatimonas rosea]MBB6053723.1 hypothetical protein [Armatimonas rosea]
MRRDPSPPSPPSLGGLFDDDEPLAAPVVAAPEPIATEPDSEAEPPVEIEVEVPVVLPPPSPEPKPLAVPTPVAQAGEPDGEILWEGAGVAHQRMDFAVLAELLRNIQLMVKRLTPTQPFTLQAGVATQPGAFCLPFYLVPETEAETGQIELIELDPETPADLLAQMLDDNATHEQISSHLTNDSVRRSYVQVMKQIAAQQLVMTFRTKNLAQPGVLTPRHATERQVWFDDAHTKVENIVLTGELQTGTIVAGSCKILCGSDQQPYTLRVDKARALQLRGIPLAGLVRASVERVTTTHPDFERPRIVHRLTHIERLDTPGLFG